MPEGMKEIEERAKRALSKGPKFGPEIPLYERRVESKEPAEQTVQKLPWIGIEMGGKGRCGTYMQLDHSVVLEKSKVSGVEIMSIDRALEEYDLRDYYWKAVEVDTDKYTALAELRRDHGYFIRAREGVRVKDPVQACLFIQSDEISQKVHNIIVAEPNSELHIITGCASLRVRGSHIGISEFYVGEGAKITFTMIHSWEEKVHARPRTGVIVERDGTFVSNYINLGRVESLQMYPVVRLTGENARARMQSVLVSKGKSYLDVGGMIKFEARQTGGEIISRGIATDSSKIIARGRLVGGGQCRGHLECRGLLLSEDAEIEALPELEAKRKDAELTHEAAIGKISEEELYYLMSRGFSEEEATSIIVRGFMEIDIRGLPDPLAMQIKRALDLTTEELL